MKARKPAAQVTARQRRLLELQVREYIERYHPEMTGSTIEISSDGLIAGVSVNPPKFAGNKKRNR
jgi:hypothetical protein